MIPLWTGADFMGAVWLHCMVVRDSALVQLNMGCVVHLQRIGSLLSNFMVTQPDIRIPRGRTLVCIKYRKMAQTCAEVQVTVISQRHAHAERFKSKTQPRSSVHNQIPPPWTGCLQGMPVCIIHRPAGARTHQIKSDLRKEFLPPETEERAHFDGPGFTLADVDQVSHLLDFADQASVDWCHNA